MSTTLFDAIRTRISPTGDVYRDRAPTDRLASPNPYAVLRATTHGQPDGITELLDVTINVYCYDDVAACEAMADAIDALLRGYIVTADGHTSGLWRTSYQPIPEDDARIARRMLVYNATWTSQAVATALSGGS